MKNSILYYSVGALLYCPANNAGIADSIIQEKFGNKFSLALCLEDTVNDNCVEQAENILVSSLYKIYSERCKKKFYLPKIFVRVRYAQQIFTLTEKLGSVSEIISGFILPKFSLENSKKYIDAVTSVNNLRKKPFYIMPIFESPSIINLKDRENILYTLKERLDTVEDIVLNIRVGGNDLCHMFGFRRSNNQSIHNIKPVANIFSDIITVYGMDYVVSGPVWEYYNGDGWETGLKNELTDDILNGFVGKTVIHPNQIEVVNSAYKVSSKDLDDAYSILNWKKDSQKLVSGSIGNERMNEYKTHSNWALKTIMISEVFGVKN
ncbi:MAG: HpcH/HpaI aldolase/citrate lyase family protein [Acutalibacteraceae bacterium]|nr:HpcH/HpaI aldolase/citrate lyase family protein [Acutalibacteraceae bacterium]